MGTQLAEMLLVSLASNPAVLGKGSALGENIDENTMNRLVHLSVHSAAQLAALQHVLEGSDDTTKQVPSPDYDGYQPAATPTPTPTPTPVKDVPLAPAPVVNFQQPKPATIFQVMSDRIRKLAADYVAETDLTLGSDIKTAFSEGAISETEKADLHSLYKDLVSPIKEAIKKASSAVQK